MPEAIKNLLVRIWNKDLGFFYKCFTNYGLFSSFLNFLYDTHSAQQYMTLKILIFSVTCPKISPCSFSSSKRNALKLIDLEPSNEIWNQKIAPHFFFVSDGRWVQRLQTLLSHNEAVRQSGVDINSIYICIFKFMKNDLLTSSFHELPIPNTKFFGFVYPVRLFC